MRTLLYTIDQNKDQSYFLSFLSQKQLSRSLFPLGNIKKEQVFELAKKYGLHTVEKKESQDFYAGDIRDLLDQNMPKGEIVNSQGHVLGEHSGLGYYTIGQRKGLGISAERPLYVIRLDKGTNRVVVGFEEELFLSEFRVKHPNWISIENLKEPMEATVKIRYRHVPALAKIIPENDGILVRCTEAQKAVTPGQVAVFYDGDVVIGGGEIVSPNV